MITAPQIRSQRSMSPCHVIFINHVHEADRLLTGLTVQQKGTTAQLKPPKNENAIKEKLSHLKTSDLKVYLVTLSDQIIHKKIIQVEVVNKIYDMYHSCLLTLLSLTP